MALISMCVCNLDKIIYNLPLDRCRHLNVFHILYISVKLSVKKEIIFFVVNFLNACDHDSCT